MLVFSKTSYRIASGCIDHLPSWSPLSPRQSVAWTSIWGWCRCQRPRSTLVLKLANPKCVLQTKKLQRLVPQRCVLLLLLAGQLLIIALTLPYLDSLQHVDLPLTATGSHEQALRCLVNRSFSKDELPSLLDTLFSGGGSTRLLRCLQRENAQVIVDILDEACHHTLDVKGWLGLPFF